MGLTATMAALVLALLIASAKSSYDAQRSEVTQISANIILLDRVLAHYGPETKDARALLRQSVAGMIDRIWPEDHSKVAKSLPTADRAEDFFDKVQELSPQNEVQRALQAQALKMSIDLGQTRWLLFEQSGRSIPMPFLVLLISGSLLSMSASAFSHSRMRPSSQHCSCVRYRFQVRSF